MWFLCARLQNLLQCHFSADHTESFCRPGTQFGWASSLTRGSAGRLPHERHAVGVAPEMVDVVAHPLQRHDVVPESGVSRRVLILRRQEAQNADPVPGDSARWSGS